MSSKLTLYFSAPSPLARACLLVARYLELDIEVKHIDLVAGDQRKPEFLKLNPRNKVPVLVDGDFVLCESKAIMAYLVNSRKAGSSLYPEDAKQRAKVDQFLYYDATVVFPSLSALVVSSRSSEEEASKFKATRIYSTILSLTTATNDVRRRQNSSTEEQRLDRRQLDYR
jgi:glutathione S-transferase